MKTLSILLSSVALISGCELFASPILLNFNPLLPAPAPVLNAGWASDRINAANVDSLDSAYRYDLACPALFTITDDFVVGDTYKVYDFGRAIFFL